MPQLEPGSKSIPPGPDPGRDVAEFLAWLMKLGGVAKLRRCKNKWERQLERENIEEVVRILGSGLIVIIPRRRGRTRNKHVMLTSEGWTWAAKWTHYYDVDIPHHRQSKRMK